MKLVTSKCFFQSEFYDLPSNIGVNVQLIESFIFSLGMRHDTAENGCDPSLFIMSPTLGSGKITWSKCSQNYLKSFLE